MRHFLLPCPPVAHPGSVHTAATMARLVAPPSLLDRASPRLPGTTTAAVRADRGCNNCTRSPGRGTRRTETDGPRADQPRLPCRHGVDERHGWQDSRPACVPGTVWGTAPTLNLQVARGAVLTPRLWQALAAPSSCGQQAEPAPPVRFSHRSPASDPLSRPGRHTPSHAAG